MDRLAGGTVTSAARVDPCTSLSAPCRFLKARHLFAVLADQLLGLFNLLTLEMTHTNAYRQASSKNAHLPV
jgi:hypothetical protein